MAFLIDLLREGIKDPEIIDISEKVLEGERISVEEALKLYKFADLTLLGFLAEELNRSKNGNKAYFITNIQINPTNVCIYQCDFCAFGVKPSDSKAYEMSVEEILTRIHTAYQKGAREVHIVGGIPAHWDYDKYVSLIKKIKETFPDIIIKAWTAVEIHHMAKISGKSYRDILSELKEAGLSALPGGGAEVFSERVRDLISPSKADGKAYIEIHRTAHLLGIPTNTTMLYGHVETVEERIRHMEEIRKLQDETGGFQVFIPLAYWPQGTRLGGKRTSAVDDLKTIALARIFLDNFKNIKAYWITLGERLTQVALNYGANDIDGTIEEEKVVHSAGTDAERGHSKEKLIEIIRKAGKVPVERDTFYNEVRIYA